MLSFLAQLPPVPASPALVGFLVLLVTGLAGFDVYRRREFLVFANLGTAPTAVVALGGITTLALELLLIALKEVFR